MKILIIEDEFRNYNRLRRMLTAYNATWVVEGPLESVEETCKWLSSHQGDSAPNIIFADIQLSDGLSFDALENVPPHSALVFTTAFDQYALKAFQYNGVAYLLKPIEEEALHHTLQRIVPQPQSTISPSTNLQALQTTFVKLQSNQPTYRQRFLLPHKDGFEVVNVADIRYVQSEFKDTRIYVETQKFYSVPTSLDELEKQLDPNDFFRVNRQFIVHISQISSLKNYFGGKLQVYLYGTNAPILTCSRERAPLLKEWLNR
ncbi:LytR/AlgR family response regulator transcription factor [Capnocytophaga gingivalis]